MLCSVIMSVFNSQNTIEASIQSILSQTFKEFEFLIVDDCSTDNTCDIVQSIKDPRIKLFNNKQNIGLTKSLNFLIKNSKGKYIARQDADDISLNFRLEKQLNLLENTEFKITTSRAYRKENKKLIPRYHLPYEYVLKYKNPFIHGTLVIEKQLMVDIGMYNEKYIYAQDYKLFSDLIKSSEKVYVFKEALYELNMSNNISKNKFNEQKYFADLVRSDLKRSIK